MGKTSAALKVGSWAISLSGEQVTQAGTETESKYLRTDVLVVDLDIRAAIAAAIAMFLHSEFEADADGDRVGSIDTISVSRAAHVVIGSGTLPP